MTDDGMREALTEQFSHAYASHHCDRTGWTDQQWVDDARQQMGDLHGSVLDLVNGHVTAMLHTIDQLTAALTTARLDAADEVLRRITEDEYGGRCEHHLINYRDEAARLRIRRLWDEPQLSTVTVHDLDDAGQEIPGSEHQVTTMIYAVEATGTDGQLHGLTFARDPDGPLYPELTDHVWDFVEDSLEQQMREAGVW